MEPLTLLPAKFIESVPPKQRKVPSHVHLGKLLPGSLLLHRQWPSPLVPVHRRLPGWACQPAQNSWPLGARVKKKLQFHFLTITRELAWLGTSELGWWVIALVIEF